MPPVKYRIGTRLHRTRSHLRLPEIDRPRLVSGFIDVNE